MKKEYQTFSEFYPFYLSQHANRTCRRLHFIGSLLVLFLIAYIIYTASWTLLFLVPVTGYGFAWVGHIFFEKNRHATFTYPLYSWIGDWVLFKDILLRKNLDETNPE